MFECPNVWYFVVSEGELPVIKDINRLHYMMTIMVQFSKPTSVSILWATTACQPVKLLLCKYPSSRKNKSTLQIKISAVSVFLQANQHSIISHLITLDKKTLKCLCRFLIHHVRSIYNTEKATVGAYISTNMKLIIAWIKKLYLLADADFYFCRQGGPPIW